MNLIDVQYPGACKSRVENLFLATLLPANFERCSFRKVLPLIILMTSETKPDFVFVSKVTSIVHPMLSNYKSKYHLLTSLFTFHICFRSIMYITWNFVSKYHTILSIRQSLWFHPHFVLERLLCEYNRFTFSQCGLLSWLEKLWKAAN